MAWWSSLRGTLERRPARASGDDGSSRLQPAPTPAVPSPPVQEWAALPALQRTLGEPQPAAPLAPFTASLAAFQDPSFLAPLGHRLDPTDGGMVNGLAELAPTSPTFHTPASELAIASSSPRSTGASVQRQGFAWPATADTVPLERLLAGAEVAPAPGSGSTDHGPVQSPIQSTRSAGALSGDVSQQLRPQPTTLGQSAPSRSVVAQLSSAGAATSTDSTLSSPPAARSVEAGPAPAPGGSTTAEALAVQPVTDASFDVPSAAPPAGDTAPIPQPERLTAVSAQLSSPPSSREAPVQRRLAAVPPAAPPTLRFPEVPVRQLPVSRLAAPSQAVPPAAPLGAGGRTAPATVPTAGPVADHPPLPHPAGEPPVERLASSEAPLVGSDPLRSAAGEVSAFSSSATGSPLAAPLPTPISPSAVRLTPTAVGEPGPAGAPAAPTDPAAPTAPEPATAVQRQTVAAPLATPSPLITATAPTPTVARELGPISTPLAQEPPTAVQRQTADGPLAPPAQTTSPDVTVGRLSSSFPVARAELPVLRVAEQAPPPTAQRWPAAAPLPGRGGGARTRSGDDRRPAAGLVGLLGEHAPLLAVPALAPAPAPPPVQRLTFLPPGDAPTEQQAARRSHSPTPEGREVAAAVGAGPAPTAATTAVQRVGALLSGAATSLRVPRPPAPDATSGAIEAVAVRHFPSSSPLQRVPDQAAPVPGALDRGALDNGAPAAYPEPQLVSPSRSAQAPSTNQPVPAELVEVESSGGLPAGDPHDVALPMPSPTASGAHPSPTGPTLDAADPTPVQRWSEDSGTSGGATGSSDWPTGSAGPHPGSAAPTPAVRPASQMAPTRIVQRQLLPVSTSARRAQEVGPPPATGTSFATMFGSPEGPGHDGFTSVQLSLDDASGPPPESASPDPVQVGTAGPPAASDPAPTASAPAAGVPAPPAAAADLDEMARRLFEPLSARIRAELWLDRERAGLMSDLRP